MCAWCLIYGRSIVVSFRKYYSLRFAKKILLIHILEEDLIIWISLKDLELEDLLGFTLKQKYFIGYALKIDLVKFYLRLC